MSSRGPYFQSTDAERTRECNYTSLKRLNESILLAYNSTSQNINITAMFLYPHFHDSERGTKGHTFLFKAVR